MRIKFIGRGTYYQQIARALGTHTIAESHIAVNWGLQGDGLRDYRHRYPSITRKPMLNERQFGNKYQCVEAARAADVPVPESFATTPEHINTKAWIRKPYYSLGGRDIHRYTENDRLPNTHYLQEDLSERRRYEVRVHAMAWVPPEQWIMQKRVHEDGESQLTWNHHTGGRFITIENTNDPLFVRIRESVITLMRTLNYQFGAVDFIVCNAGERGRPLPHYFIEWNLAPGWTLDHVRDYYISSFRQLSRMELDDVTMMIEGGMLNGAPALTVETQEAQAPRRVVQQDDTPNFTEITERFAQALEPEIQAQPEPEPRRVEVVSSRVIPEQPTVEDDAARYAAMMADMADNMNFCPQCGRGVNTDIFGAMPRFCPGCGQQVRA